jgi:hypothetical protein
VGQRTPPSFHQAVSSPGLHHQRVKTGTLCLTNHIATLCLGVGRRNTQRRRTLWQDKIRVDHRYDFLLRPSCSTGRHSIELNLMRQMCRDRRCVAVDHPPAIAYWTGKARYRQLLPIRQSSNRLAPWRTTHQNPRELPMPPPIGKTEKAAKVSPDSFRVKSAVLSYFKFVFASFFGAGADSDFCFLSV